MSPANDRLLKPCSPEPDHVKETALDLKSGWIAGALLSLTGFSAIWEQIEQEAKMAKVTTMEELFLDEIRDLYDAERQLLEALPGMARPVSSPELRNAFEEHLEQTRIQIRRLERIFEVLGEKAAGRKCAAMTGLITAANEIAGANGDAAVRDAGLIAAAQKMQHYEISGYGSARAHAEILGDDRAARLLSETLFEEKEADERLTELAESIINSEAVRPRNDGRPRTRGAGGAAASTS